MTEHELPKAFVPGEMEQRWYSEWETRDYFSAKLDGKPMYCIVIPPPNVTGALHLGHALNNTLQDILIRYNRMDGKDALWVPGTDHAGIATQNVVEKQLKTEGKTRHDLGREAFLERVWEWRTQYGNRIISQLKTLGCSCDWNRERFTMDEGLSAAVRKVFVDLYKEGLIYRDRYIINWCPRCHTALSDVEVEHQERKGSMWHIRYKRSDGKGDIVVATTRPETMLGDTAVAVNPDDERYTDLVGKTVILPLVNRELPVIADKYVDPAFGTGIVKITPGHDPNDFLIGQRHKLPLINILNDDATLNEEAGPYAGLKCQEARKRVLADLEAQGLLEKTDAHVHQVGECYRCRTTVEPYTAKKQWFVKMQPLAEPAIKAVEEGRTTFHPDNWKNLYFEWMRNIRDWCISRQIWWGHRIPAWYCPCGEIIVAEQAPTACPKCGGTQLEQDHDVLDTWFSSALWPFSTMGWPQQTPELAKFYPNSVLSTAFDIIYFWVARMIVMGLHFMKEVPFKDVYIHALIRTATGEKMSKSSGNQIDPIDMINKYGCDALRFTLAALAAQGRDVRLSEERIDGYRHFVNKLWNASRFALMNGVAEAGPLDRTQLADEDHWLLAQLDEAIVQARKSIEGYRFNDYGKTLYDFTWHKLCDWYLEMAKPRLTGGDAAAATVRAVLKHVLKRTLELLHPAMPFVTEEIWQKLRDDSEAASIMIAPFPAPRGGHDAVAVAKVARLQEIIGAVRTIRGEMGIDPKQELSIVVEANADDKAVIENGAAHFRHLAKVTTIGWYAGGEPSRPAAAAALTGLRLWIPLAGVIDLDKERARLQKEIGKLAQYTGSVEKKLGNQSYVANAPAEVVDGDRARLAEAQARIAVLNGYLAAL